MMQNPIDELETCGYPSSKLERHTASLLAENFAAASLAYQGNLAEFESSISIFVHNQAYADTELNSLDIRIVLLLTLNELLMMQSRRRQAILAATRQDILQMMNVFALSEFDDYSDLVASAYRAL